MKLAIVRGHRKGSQGAVAADGTTEWQWAGWLGGRIMTRALELGHAAQVFERPNGSSYTRNLAELTAEVNAWRPTLVLSLHFDASPNGQPWSGSTGLYWPGEDGGKPVDRDGRTYAIQLAAACSRGIGIRDRGARGQAKSWNDAWLFILRDTDAPAVILETHFGLADHVRAMAALTEPAPGTNAGKLADAIVRALPPVRTT